jgi:hypothetical protein
MDGPPQRSRAVKDSDLRLIALRLATELPPSKEDARRCVRILQDLLDTFLWPAHEADIRPRGRP